MLRLILTLRFWYWYFLMTLLTVSRSSLMALAMSLWKETRTGKEIFGQAEPCNFGFISPVNRANWNFLWNHRADSSVLARKIYAYEIPQKNAPYWGNGAGIQQIHPEIYMFDRTNQHSRRRKGRVLKPGFSCRKNRNFCAKLWVTDVCPGLNLFKYLGQTFSWTMSLAFWKVTPRTRPTQRFNSLQVFNTPPPSNPVSLSQDYCLTSPPL